MAGVRKARRLSRVAATQDSAEHILVFFHFKSVIMLGTEVSPKVFGWEGHSVRTTYLLGQSWLVAQDVCSALRIRNYRDAVSSLDADERMESELPTPSRGFQKMILVNESGLYHLIFKSRKPEAQAFRKWVTQEVLPVLRKTGHYSVGQPHNGKQGDLFPVQKVLDVPDSKLREIQQLMLDVALKSSYNSKAGRLVKLLKPIVYGTEAGL
jgi:prophage antirepressor-like protein